MTFEFAVNKKTANVLGITLPRSILLRADRVIELRRTCGHECKSSRTEFSGRMLMLRIRDIRCRDAPVRA